MLGPVPTKYRVIVWLCGLAAFTGLGAWLSPAMPLSAAGAGVLGLTLGAAAVALYLHDFDGSGRAAAWSRESRSLPGRRAGTSG